MKKLEMAKQKSKEIAQKGKEIWDKNKVFIGIVGGAVLYAVAERFWEKPGKYDNPSKVKVYMKAGSGHKFAVDEKVEYYNRFGKLVDVKYGNYTADQAEDHIKMIEDCLNEWSEREYPGD